jgi:predicted nuclease of predicted toxin-antitoxin system
VNFLLDHDVPERIADVLHASGHEVVRLRQILSCEASDSDVLGEAHQRGAVLITCNRDDFLSLARAQPHSGIVVLIRRRSRIAECAALLKLIDRSGGEGMKDNINFA